MQFINSTQPLDKRATESHKSCHNEATQDQLLHKGAWEPERRTLKINIAICEKKIKTPTSLNCTELLFRTEFATGMEGFACGPTTTVSILYSVDDRISSLIMGHGGLVTREMSLPLLHHSSLPSPLPSSLHLRHTPSILH